MNTADEKMKIVETFDVFEKTEGLTVGTRYFTCHSSSPTILANEIPVAFKVSHEKAVRLCDEGWETAPIVAFARENLNLSKIGQRRKS